MREEVAKLWPELQWIRDEKLREATAMTWVKAFELSPLTPRDLHEIPFTLLAGDCRRAIRGGNLGIEFG